MISAQVATLNASQPLPGNRFSRVRNFERMPLFNSRLGQWWREQRNGGTGSRMRANVHRERITATKMRRNLPGLQMLRGGERRSWRLRLSLVATGGVGTPVPATNARSLRLEAGITTWRRATARVAICAEASVETRRRVSCCRKPLFACHAGYFHSVPTANVVCTKSRKSQALAPHLHQHNSQLGLWVFANGSFANAAAKRDDEESRARCAQSPPSCAGESFHPAG